jgi:hypothetical protein
MNPDPDRPRIMKNLARSLVSTMKDALGRAVWSIGIFTGDSPLTLAPPPGLENPVLTRHDIAGEFALFVADPFMIPVDGTWHMFFEALVWRGRGTKGVIGHATSSDGLRWSYQRVVLEEPFHLSYPHVFAWGSDFYLVPESAAAGVVRLYRADPFPSRWVHVADLLSGPVLLDCSVFHHDGRWWMFAETSPTMRDDTLRLFHAPELTGPWREHPRSPIVSGDPRAARPAGRVLTLPDRLIRFAQDCYPAYGTGVKAFEVRRLSVDEYEEVEVPGGPVLRGGGEGWRRRGMHQVDAHQLPDGRWIGCVDGWYRGLVEPREILKRIAGARLPR